MLLGGGVASGMLAVEISSSSPGSGLCCDLSLIVFGSNLLARLTGSKSSFGPRGWKDSGFSWGQQSPAGTERSSGGLGTPHVPSDPEEFHRFNPPVSFQS